MKINFTANPTQAKFIESRAEADLFNSRKGEGKSAGLVWAAWYYTKHNPGADGVCIRDTFVNLERTTLKEFFYWFPDGSDFGSYRTSEQRWTWGPKSGLSGSLLFMGAQDATDATKIASMPLAYGLFDEPSGAVDDGSGGIDEFVFDTVKAQLRQRGMKWYALKLAQNNPDETHWTYARFIDPGTPGDETIACLPLQERGFKSWQTGAPENLQNLPPGYYENMMRAWAHRPDLVKRFAKGEFGFTQTGIAVTPQWRNHLHLAPELKPVKGIPLTLLWDGGGTPACVITQLTPLGDWLILESFVEPGMGMYELITDVVKPILSDRYFGFLWSHAGDPNLESPDQSSVNQSAARVIRKELGGVFHPGPHSIDERLNPLQAILNKNRDGRGRVLVDRKRAYHVWHALRGGWHYHVTRGGKRAAIAKDIHSHPGDCMGYGAAKLFPLGQLKQGQRVGEKSKVKEPGDYFGTAPHPGTSLGMARKDVKLPKQARTIGGT